MSTKNWRYEKAQRYLHRQVKVKTKTGATLYGTIEKVTPTKLYLKVNSIHNKGSKVHATVTPFVLPLVLFDLLAILLLQRRRRFF